MVDGELLCEKAILQMKWHLLFNFGQKFEDFMWELVLIKILMMDLICGWSTNYDPPPLTPHENFKENPLSDRIYTPYARHSPKTKIRQ